MRALRVFFFFSKILDVAFSPYSWAIACFALAVPWRGPRGARRWRRRRGFGIAGLVVLVLFGMPPVSNRLLRWLEQKSVATDHADVTYDVVVLLGGVSDDRVWAETGQPAYNDNVERLVATHRVLASGHARTAIVSGAPSEPSLAPYGEARALAKQITDWGVDASRVILEEEARNTYENAVYSKRIVEERGYKSVLIVTSAFHMRRAAECFQAVGLDVDTMPVDYRSTAHASSWLPRAQSLAESSMTLREIFGLYVYRMRGYAKAKR